MTMNQSPGDFFSALLQVSFATKYSANSRQRIRLWLPLVKKIQEKRRHHLDGLPLDMMVSVLQHMDGFEFTSEELTNLNLPNLNNRMGSSKIESLSDDGLCLCFSFLDLEDICLGIERTSHRFLQVSRKLKRPFHQHWLRWETKEKESSEFNTQISINTPFDRLIFSKPRIPRSMSLRSLRRFKVPTLQFDPKVAVLNRYSLHDLQFIDVIRAIGESVEYCDIFGLSSKRFQSYFPRELSNAKEIEIDELNRRDIPGFIAAFRHCESLSIDLSGLNNPEDWRFLNSFTKLRKLDITDIEFNRPITDLSSIMDPSRLRDLSVISLSSSALPIFGAVLPQINELSLDCDSPFNDWEFSGDLSQLRTLELDGEYQAEYTEILQKHFELPSILTEMTICIEDWNVLLDWVHCVNHLHFLVDSRSPLIASDLHDPIIAGWKVKECLISLNVIEHIPFDFITSLVNRATMTQFAVTVRDQTGGEIAELESLLNDAVNCEVIRGK